MEIMKDSRHGTYGVAALSTSIVLRWVSLATVASSHAVFAGLVAAHTLGRGGAVAAMAVFPSARDAGLGAEHARRLRPIGTSIGLAVALAVVVLATGWWAAWLLGVAVVGTAAVGMLAMRKIGGLTGDVLGAIEQVVECVVLVTVSGLASRHVLWWA
jgi:adenosylcobinamide-GDP ribazoletransferase